MIITFSRVFWNKFNKGQRNLKKYYNEHKLEI